MSKIKNRDNYWSPSHQKFLYYLAKICRDKHYAGGGVKDNLVLDELVSYAWMESARKCDDVRGCGGYFLAAMNKYIRIYEESLNLTSRIRMNHLNDIEGHEDQFCTRVNQSLSIESRDSFVVIVALIRDPSTRGMLIDYFVGQLTKAEISRKYGIGKCSVGSRISRAIHRLKVIVGLRQSVYRYVFTANEKCLQRAIPAN